MPVETLRTTAVLVVQPLWFIGIYAAVTALTPLALMMDRRLRAYATLPSLAVVAGIDLLVRPVGRCGAVLARTREWLAWFPVHAVVLGGCVTLARRFEEPWKEIPRPMKATAVMLAARFGLYAATAL